jgi:hypothetical protein
VDGLAQVQGQVLAAAAALAPDVGDPGRPGHDRDGDARPEPMLGREERVFTDEGDAAAGVLGGQSEVVHHRAELRVDVKASRTLRCVAGHDVSFQCGGFVLFGCVSSMPRL